MFMHGLAGVSAARQDRLEEAATQLAAARALQQASATGRADADYVLMARAALAERTGDVPEPLAALTYVLDPEYGGDDANRLRAPPAPLRPAPPARAPGAAPSPSRAPPPRAPPRRSPRPRSR